MMTKSGIIKRGIFGDIKNKPIQTRAIRYQASGLSGTATAVTSNELRNFVGTTINGSTAFYSVIDSIRLTRVKLTGALSGTAGCVGLVFTWKGTNVPDIDLTCEVSLSNPGVIVAIPPKDSSSAWWYDDQSTSTNLFTVRMISIDSGDAVVFMDVGLEYTLNDGTVTPLTLSSSVQATGVTYLQLGGNQFIPLGLTNAHV